MSLFFHTQFRIYPDRKNEEMWICSYHDENRRDVCGVVEYFTTSELVAFLRLQAMVDSERIAANALAVQPEEARWLEQQQQNR